MLRTTAREVLRHTLHRSGLGWLLNRWRVSRGQDTGHLELQDRGRVFSYVYDRGIWLNKRETGARSGLGSELQSTERLRTDLAHVLQELEVTTLLDVGCGDFTWMQHVDLGTIHYVGVDVVPSVIEANASRHSAPGRRFAVLDAAADELPTSDAVLCREVLFHLSLDDASAVLTNVRSSGAKYLIATHDTSTSFNADITTGDFRVLNLERRPFRLPTPGRWIPDPAVSPTRGLGVWKLR